MKVNVVELAKQLRRDRFLHALADWTEEKLPGWVVAIVCGTFLYIIVPTKWVFFYAGLVLAFKFFFGPVPWACRKLAWWIRRRSE